MNYPYYGYGNGNISQQYQGIMQNQIQQPQDERIWVQGKLSADAYLVAPNSFVRLWDSTANVFYEKRADATGRPYMETYEYKKKEYSTAPTVGVDDRITALEQRLKALEGVIKNVPESDSNDTAIPTV